MGGPGQAAFQHVLPHRGQVGHDVAHTPAGAGGHRGGQPRLVEHADEAEQAGPGLAVELGEGRFRHGRTIGPAGGSPAPGGGRWETRGVGTIRALRPEDWDDWRALWGGYLAFYRAELPDEVSRATFERLCAGAEGLFGLLALDEAGRGIGMANCVVHASTWSTASPSATWRTSSWPPRRGATTPGAPSWRR